MIQKGLYLFDTDSQYETARSSSYEEPWISYTKENGEVHYNKGATFGGLEISQGPLYYNGSAFEIKPHWNYDSFGQVYGKTEGSTYFAWESGVVGLNIDGWRLPTQSEFVTLTTGTRNGSTVNDTSNSKYSLIQVTGVTHANSSPVNGLLLFPDNKIITGKTLSGINNTTQTTGVTESELNTYLKQGCAFLPISKWWSDYTKDWVDRQEGIYLSKTNINSAQFGVLAFTPSIINPSDSGSKNGYCYSARLVR